VTSGFDVIGDVHGHADKLEGLLAKLEYVFSDGICAHPTRKAVFIGDLIDRGPRQLDTVRIARRMVDAGEAHIVMGNHEFNAIAWFLPNPDSPSDRLRTHLGKKGAKNRRQHEAFLREVGEDSDEHAEIIAWFKTLPLWLDLGDVRFVHACWNAAGIEHFEGRLGPGNTLNDDLVHTMSIKGHDDYEHMEILLKGPEIELPGGLSYLDHQGYERNRARFVWWNENATTYDLGALIPGGTTTPDGAPFPALQRTEIPKRPVEPYGDDVPLFFGHYWCTEETTIVGQHALCVDYSAGKGDPLKAYRWDGEKKLDPSKLVSFG
jgi:hypothetical protein